MTTRLTPKQSDFVEAYLKYQNGVQAYKEVYDRTGRMAYFTAGAAASRMLKLVKVQEAIKERQEVLQKLNPDCTIEELTQGWADEIRFDIADLFDEDGRARNPRNINRKARQLIQSIKVKETTLKTEGNQITVERYVEYKLPDRQKARIELGKRIGFYPTDKNAHTGEVTVMTLSEEDRRLAKEAVAAWRKQMIKEIE
jgi:phage terminase small subunit